MNLLCVTGTRADYGIYRPLLLELNKEEEIRLQLVVTGMHLLKEFGQTENEVNKDSFPIVAAPQILLRGDSTYAMSQSVGLAVLYFADILNFHQPDMVLLLGDRGEMLAAAIAAHYQNIVIAHLYGGELSGSADDAARHAITKLAHLHFVSTRRAEATLLHMGEEAWRITVVGTLRKHDIQRIRDLPAETIASLESKYNLGCGRKKIMVAMHPDSKETVPVSDQISVVTEALAGFSKVTVLIIGPNSDAGGSLFQERLRRFAKQRSNCKYYPSVSPDEYLFLLSRADLLLGNSSSGFTEAPFFDLPFINVGNRQTGREAGLHVSAVPYDAGLIRKAIEDLLRQEKTATANPYDPEELPARIIVNKLHSLPDRVKLLGKQGCAPLPATGEETF